MAKIKMQYNYGKSVIIASLIVLLLCGHGWAACPSAHCYVSNAATNGYVVGDDANTGASKAAPFLTYGKAVSMYSAGDTIHLNDGDYLTTDGANGATYITLTKAVTILPESLHGVKITSTNATYNHYVNPSATGSYIFGGLVLDCNTTSAIGVSTNNTAFTPTFTFNNTKFLNFTLRGISIGEDNPASVNINDVTMRSVSSRNDVEILATTSLQSGNVLIDGIDVDITQGGGVGSMNGIKILSSTGTGSTVSIKNISGYMRGNGGASSQISPGFISLDNIPGYTISDIDIVFTGLVGTYGIFIYPTSINGQIYDVSFSVNWTSGYMVRALAENTKIYDCVFSNANTDQTKTPHGIVVGYDIAGSDLIDASEVYRNTVSGFCPAYHFVNTGDDVIFHHNIAYANYGNYVLYAKGALGSKFYNNTVYSSSGYNGNCFALQPYDPAGENQHNNNVEYKNNICYNSSSNPIFLFTDANQTAVFDSNLFFATETLIANSWQYGGTNYGSFAAWNAIDSTAKWGNPLFKFTTDYRLRGGSPAKNAGVDVGLTTDFLGKPIKGLPDIGAYEYRGGWFMIPGTNIWFGGGGSGGSSVAIAEGFPYTFPFELE